MRRMNKSTAIIPSMTILSLPKWPKRNTQKNLQGGFGDYKCGPTYLVRQLDSIFELEKDSALTLLELRGILFILLNGIT